MLQQQIMLRNIQVASNLRVASLIVTAVLGSGFGDVCWTQDRGLNDV